MAPRSLIVGCVAVLAIAVAGKAASGQGGGFAYVANCGSACGGTGLGDISAYAIDGITGALTPVAGSPFATGLFPQSVTVDPTSKYAYVANERSNNVSAYSIDATGALTPIVGSPFVAGAVPFAVTVAPGGQFAYAANERSSNISAYSIDAAGTLTPIASSPGLVGSFPRSVATTPGAASRPVVVAKK